MPTPLPTHVTLVSVLHGQKKEQVRVPIETAGDELAARNAAATNGFIWQLCSTNFLTIKGDTLAIDDANALRRACGVEEY